MAAFLKYCPKLQSKKISLNTRMKMFKIYISSIFLYSSELWTLTKKLEHKIDVFQRQILKKILKIKYPTTIRNETLYTKTNETPWSEIIKTRRLRWTGHMLRLPKQTPVRQSLDEAKKYTKIQKINKRTWIKEINNNLIEIDEALSLDRVDICYLAEDREWWRRNIVRGSSVVSSNDISQPRYLNRFKY